MKHSNVTLKQWIYNDKLFKSLQKPGVTACGNKDTFCTTKLNRCHCIKDSLKIEQPTFKIELQIFFTQELIQLSIIFPVCWFVVWSPFFTNLKLNLQKWCYKIISLLDETSCCEYFLQALYLITSSWWHLRCKQNIYLSKQTSLIKNDNSWLNLMLLLFFMTYFWNTFCINHKKLLVKNFMLSSHLQDIMNLRSTFAPFAFTLSAMLKKLEFGGQWLVNYFGGLVYFSFSEIFDQLLTWNFCAFHVVYSVHI